MKRALLSTTILGISLLLPSQASAAAFSTIYSFGDSLSDTGNVFATTGGAFPPGPPIGQYSEGRFSNGKIWIEYLKDKLGIPLVDSAFGGATTGKVNTLNNFLGLSVLPGLEQEILSFAANNPVADSNALYVVWAGANDYLPNASSYNTPDTPLNNIKMAVDTLVGIGAKKIMVVNLPDLGKIPQTSGLSADGICPPNINTGQDADCLNELTVAHNAGLLNLFSSLPPEIQIFQVDVNSLLDNIIANPTQFGFTNVTDACYIFPNSPCSNSNEYFFWDTLHPSTEGHRLVGELAFNALGIPEPLTILGTSTAFLFGTFFKKEISQRRKQNKSN